MPDRAIWRVAVLIAVMLSATACNAGLTSAGSVGGAGACRWTTQSGQSPSGDLRSNTVVLIDDSASFWPERGGSVNLPDSPVQVAVSELLTDFAGPGTRLVSLGTFDGSSSTIDWVLGRVALPVPTGNGAAITAEQQAAATCLDSVVTSAAGATPRMPGTDEMAALAAAGAELQGSPPADDRVALITDGLSNSGCLNLSSVISQGQSAATILANCPEHAGLAALRGVSLHLFGIGFQAANPPLTTAEQAWVENYWSDLCAALGVASPAMCVAPAEDQAMRTSSVIRLADLAIAFPTVPPKAPSLLVPADLLFAFDSAVISEAGQSYLDILLQDVKAKGRTITEVIGHTDAIGTAAYNLGLSRRRAAAIQAYLAAHGFPGAAALGVGEADPACSPEFSSTGAPIESCMARDRRVQIILGG